MKKKKGVSDDKHRTSPNYPQLPLNESENLKNENS